MNEIAGGAPPEGPLAAAIVAAMTDTILILDPMGRIMFISTAYAEAFGRELEYWIGQSALDMIHPDDQAHVATHIRSAIERPEAVRQFVQVRFDSSVGPWVAIEVHGFNPIEFEGSTCVLISVRDTTGQLTLRRARQLAGESIRTSYADLATNRQMVVDILLPEMFRGSGAEHMVIVCLSITNYAELVDEFGTAKTSAFMAQLAHGLAAQSRPADLVARTSEHQLLLACPDIETTRQANDLAKRVRTCGAGINANLMPLEIHVGFALTSVGDDFDEVLDFASSAPTATA